jgi:ParB-like chromosome segregation protein Spo0J
MTAKQIFSTQSWPIEKLIPYTRNAKLHTPAQIDKIAGLIATHGFDVPIVVDRDGVIIKGHGRRLAGLQLGLSKVPVIQRSDLSPAQVRAARLADNRVAQGDYDSELLQSELVQLLSEDVVLSGLGFDEKELNFLTGDLAVMDDKALLVDLDTEITAQTERIEQQVRAAGARQVPLGEAFGFKHVLPAEAAAINGYMAVMEASCNRVGVAALLFHLQESLG